MLNDFTWNMTGYIPKHHVNPHGDGIIPYVAERIFQLEPEPPAVGNLKEKLYLNRAGTPGDDDYIVSFDVVLKPGMGQEREGVLAAHHACDEFIQIFREQMKKFRGDLCTERHEYHDVVRPGKKRVLIVKQVAGQGAMYDTSLFAKEPSGTEDGRSIIDMGNMPVIVTPNEYRDGIIRSMQ